MYIELVLCAGGVANVDFREIVAVSPEHCEHCDSGDGAKVTLKSGMTFVVRGAHGALAALVNKPAPATSEDLDEMIDAVTVGEIGMNPITYASLDEALAHIKDCWLANIASGFEETADIRFTLKKMKRSELEAAPEWEGP